MARIAITGAGIIGCAAAVHLIERGHQVTVFEKDLSGLPASVGNAGILAVPEIDPLARPDMLFSAPKWLADPLGPLTLRWQDLPANAQAYLNRLEELCQVPVAIISTGPERDETILRQHPFE